LLDYLLKNASQFLQDKVPLFPKSKTPYRTRHDTTDIGNWENKRRISAGLETLHVSAW